MITVLLAGTPCSGVRLLTELLRTHPNVFVSPQTGLFSHSVLWSGEGNAWRQQYQAFMRRQTELPLSLACPLIPPVDEQALSGLGIDSNFLLSLIENCQDGRELIKGVQEYVEALEGPSVWLDAAHVNLFGVLAFLRANPSGLAILMRRHALEHISALVTAGYGFKEAARLWFAEAALGRYIAGQMPEQVHLVDREDLILNTRVVLDSLSDWLGVGRIIPLVSHPVQLPAAELEERHLAYLFGLKLAPDFARLIGEVASPAWRGAEMVEWTGARLI